jgi:signal transduction histidine kinase/response regulator RpfG family c-di-GMP phosphodiesterase
MAAILIVDDHAANREFLTTLLGYRDHRTWQACDAMEALTLARSVRPDLIITDILMPAMDGYEFVRQLRLDPQIANTPVIFCTADYREREAQQLARACGVAHLLIKPCDPELVLRTVESALGLATETLVRAPPQEFDRDHLRLVTDKLSGKAAELQSEVVERKRAQDRLQEQLARLDLLQRITRAIAERQDLQSIFQVVIRRLEDNLPIDFGCICLYEPIDRTLTVVSVGVRGGELAKDLATTQAARIALDTNGLSRCVQGELVYESDVAEAPFAFPQRLAAANLRALVAAPLLAESKVFGVLIAARERPESFSSGDCEFLRQLSEHVALAAHQAQLYTALQQAYEDLRQSQRAVMQQERLRALGQMASGVAHDINNAISPVALYTESLLELESNLSDRARSYLGTIQRAIEDVAQTVSRMREFYRPREPQLISTRICLNRLVGQVVEFTRARWRDVPQQHGIVIDLDQQLAADLPDIMGAEGDIRDALTNLVFNAVDAMPEGGKLIIRTRTGAAAALAQLSQAVCLEVCDAGIGMDEETKRRCLEPFFTTKGERGTGLGLAMVYGMAQRHGAETEIDSIRGKGTTIRLVFPAAPAASSAASPQLLQAPERSLSILIVDDDPLVLESMQATLQSDGHKVTAADGGRAGIDAFVGAEQRNERFSVVITDLGMPYIDGRKVAATIKARSPATPVILLTGWGQRMAAENEMPAHIDRVLSKPPRLAELRRALAEVVAHRVESPVSPST